MRLVVTTALAACLLACAPAEEAEVTSAGCAARGAWSAADGAYSAEATTSGPDCARAVAMIVIRDRSGAPIYSAAHVTEYVMSLASVQDAAAMQSALNEWVTPSDPQTTGGLPAWPANAVQPGSGEFPFYVNDGIDRAEYERIRAADGPLFCYVQGMESLDCVALQQGSAVSVGLQTFPG